MGAGAKCDPTRVQISDISYTMYDPLARSVRRRLRVQGVASGVPVVYSTEVPGEVKLLPLAPADFEKGNVKELGAFDDFRVRILPVIGARAINLVRVVCNLMSDLQVHYRPSLVCTSPRMFFASSRRSRSATRLL